MICFFLLKAEGKKKRSISIHLTEINQQKPTKCSHTKLRRKSHHQRLGKGQPVPHKKSQNSNHRTLQKPPHSQMPSSERRRKPQIHRQPEDQESEWRKYGGHGSSQKSHHSLRSEETKQRHQTWEDRHKRRRR